MQMESRMQEGMKAKIFFLLPRKIRKGFGRSKIDLSGP